LNATLQDTVNDVKSVIAARVTDYRQRRQQPAIHYSEDCIKLIYLHTLQVAANIFR